MIIAGFEYRNFSPDEGNDYLERPIKKYKKHFSGYYLPNPGTEDGSTLDVPDKTLIPILGENMRKILAFRC